MEKLNGTSMNNTLHSGDTSWTLPAEAHPRRFAGSVALPLFKSKKYLQTFEYGVNTCHRPFVTPQIWKCWGPRFNTRGAFVPSVSSAVRNPREAGEPANPLNLYLVQ